MDLAVIILVLPTAEHEYTYRYVIPAVPLVCMAAALAFRRRDGEVRPQPGTRQERTPPPVNLSAPRARPSGPDPGRPRSEPGRPGSEPEPA